MNNRQGTRYRKIVMSRIVWIPMGIAWYLPFF